MIRMNQKIVLMLLISISMGSCIAHKDIVYFQGDTVTPNKIKEINNISYRLHADDVLFIDLKAADENLVSLFKNNENTKNAGQITESNMYYTGYSVDKQGFISIPYLGKINVLGYTTEEVSQKIKDGLSKFFVNTNEIFISVKLAGFRYIIIGEVGSSGTKVMNQNSVNVIEAVANAGDINITGDKKNVEIIRQSIEGVRKYKLDLTSIKVFESEVFYLQPNDIINVPPLKQKTYGTGTNGIQTFTTVVSVLSVLTTTFLLIKSL